MKERKETEKGVYYTNESNDSGQLFDLLMNDTDQDDDGGKGSGGAELVGPPVEQNTFNVEEEIIMHDGEDVEEQSEVHDYDDDDEEEETGSGFAANYSTPTSTTVVVDTTTSYHCNDTPTAYDASNNINNNNGSTTTNNKGKITKQLIQFDYDILLSKTSSSVLLQSKQREEEKKKRYSNEDRDDSIEEEEDDDDIDPEVIIAEFEQQLLNDVGFSLNDAGICNNSSESKEDDSQEGVRRMMVLRKVGHRRAATIATGNANSQDGISSSEGVDLAELSSLPLDEIDDSATCTKDSLQQSFNSNEEGMACYPVTGYMTAYFTSSSNTDNDNATPSSENVQSKIQDIIQRTMMETSSSTLKGSSASSSIVGVYYVGDRETFTYESQLDSDSISSHGKSNGQVAASLPNTEQSSSMNTGILIGTILGTLAAFLLVTLFVLRRRRTKKQRKNGGTKATVENDDGLDHECYARGNGNIIQRNIMVDEERSVIPQIMDFSTSSPPSSSSFMVGNIPTHEYSPEGQQRREDQWVSRTMTTETDMTPVVSNITSSSSKQQRYSYNRSGNHMGREEVIQEFDEDDYDEDDEEESYY